MPKDIHGKYHPPKGKPSDTRKEEPKKELKEESTGDEHLSHPNRNTSKKRDRSVPRDQQQQDEPRHGRTGRELKSETGEVIGEEPGFLPGEAGRAMQVIDEADIRRVFVELAKYPADVCVSVYLGHPGSLGLKDALLNARRQMEAMGIIGVMDTILEPAMELVKDEDLWRGQPKGMALFLAPEYHARMLLPYDPGNEVQVHTSFILAPLTPMVSGKGDYFVLALSKHRAQLYRSQGFGLETVDIPEMPLGMEDVIQYEEKEIGGMIHGDEDKKRIGIYLREVDRTLRTTA
ncbi:MAG TPA: hypothetical protein VNW04_09225, partial [Puia sp.]|nr:hypothetical protein [Puia sp.]